MAKIKLGPIDEKKLSELPIVGKRPANEKEEAKLKEISEYEFYNSEEPGLSVQFPYGSTKKNVIFTFVHGEKYKLPRHVARHVESCSTPIYEWKPNGKGQMQKVFAGIKSRFQMRPVYS